MEKWEYTISVRRAVRDALEKPSILRCPIERPVDVAIKWMLDGI